MLANIHLKKILLIFIFSILSLNALPQTESPSGGFRNRIFTGGNIGLQFGNQTIIEVAPIVGYRITEKLSAGLGAKYLYYRYKDAFINYSTDIYGGSVFTRYLITENLFAHLEYEILNLEIYDDLLRTFRRDNITSVFAGGGYRQMLGTRSSINIMLLYNLNESRHSPYQNPIIRIGFGIGF
ncbi:MAG: hypothetical protein DWQ44_11850 [Bacteroidetes bacterium]|nr:MAG: hypothetical protein DWQ33_10810 [Bacteroidota bacterium]REK05313.1 MAG: hypothetical protein DWQ39_08975 [Bacteroidota bacterium]REK32719.1 MAG: hypothetical protein DWQ44_11850 [Bacteroidota bacterium]REK48835.1 MAG: hypothetical protein DWQ48_08115 [Bacteroidota bacterium]